MSIGTALYAAGLSSVKAVKLSMKLHTSTWRRLVASSLTVLAAVGEIQGLPRFITTPYTG